MKKIYNYFDKFNFINFIENIKTWKLLIVIFSIYYLGFVPKENEENYLQLAKSFFNPEWIPNSFMFSEVPGTRLLYQYFVGFFLNFLSFEITTILLRGILIIGFSLVLSKIYKKIKVNNLCISIQLILLYLYGHQSLFANSWMFISVEAKGFAYFFALLGLYQLLNKREYLALIFVVISTYFHVLVGFYMFFYIILTSFSIKEITFKNIKNSVLKVTIYLIAISPFVLYLLTSTKADPSLKPNADWIYTYYRNPHHTALFKSLNYFLVTHFKGILYSLLGLIILISLKKQKKNSYEVTVLYNFAIISLFFTLILVPLAYFDKVGTFLKFYPYRINTVSTFLLTILITKWVYNTIKTQYLNYVYMYSIMILSLSLISVIGLRVKESVNYIKTNPLDEIYTYIKMNTEKESVIFSFSDDEYDMTRKMERTRFVSFKFVPADLSKIHEWYNRVEAKKIIAKNIDSLETISKKYKIDYLITSTQTDASFLKPIYNNEAFFLYKLQK